MCCSLTTAACSLYLTAARGVVRAVGAYPVVVHFDGRLMMLVVQLVEAGVSSHMMICARRLSWSSILSRLIP